MFADIFLFLTADVLQQHANTKTLALWPHVSFAKCDATLTKSWHHRKRKVLDTKKSNKSVHFYHHGSKTGFGLST